MPTMRVAGSLHWLQVAVTTLLTFYAVTCKRGEIIAGMVGVLVHDHFAPYFGLPGVLHALCNAHHLRELKALTEIEKEPWATDMARLLRLACHAASRARGSPVRPSFVAVFTARYRHIVADGLAFHQPPLDPRGRTKRGRPKRRPISSFACAITRTASCASCTTRPFPSPTISPSRADAWPRSR